MFRWIVKYVSTWIVCVPVIALEQLNYERSSEILAAVAVTGQTCQLLGVCDAIIAGIAK